MDGDKWASRAPLQFLEIFAGKAKVSKMANVLGLETRAVDINYDQPRFVKSTHNQRNKRSAMDINGEAGFVSTGIRP